MCIRDRFYGYEYAGVEDGKMLIYTDEGEKVPVSEADAKYKRYIGNGTPTSYLSWSCLLYTSTGTMKFHNGYPSLGMNFRGQCGKWPMR